MLSSMCEDTKLKAIHNFTCRIIYVNMLSSMCEDTKLKAIHNALWGKSFEPEVVFNVRRY